jgi:hypothetical protein
MWPGFGFAPRTDRSLTADQPHARIESQCQFTACEYRRSSSLGFLAACLCHDRDPLRFPIDVCNRHRPERNKIDSRHELRHKRWQKLPMPAKKVDQRSSNSEVEYVIRRRLSSLDE